MIATKRAYDPPSPGDGRRVLVDRLWPRGISRESLRLQRWEKDVAPSDELRRWFGHQPERFDEFARRYREELRRPSARAVLEQLADDAAHGMVTLVYSAKDREHNQAVVLQDQILAAGRSRGRRSSLARNRNPRRQPATARARATRVR